MKKIENILFQLFLSENTRMQIEKRILNIALLSFIVHLLIIAAKEYNLIFKETSLHLLESPIAAIYTPFSFILIYEVYLLIYYLPKSFTIYINKQYEIITLIIIRKLFQDLSLLELTSNWFEVKGDIKFTYDIIASLLLFFLIYLFQKQSTQNPNILKERKIEIGKFIRKKKMIAVFLVPLFFSMALFTLVSWGIELYEAPKVIPSFEKLDNLFFEQFFMVLILVDVILLLISFFYTHQFHKIIRNSGFIVSTILIRMSFGVSGLVSTILIVVAVIFGLAILNIHNKYEQQ